MALVQSQQQEPLHMTEAEYLAFEEASDIRHEYVNGYVKAMAGASWTHPVITQSTGTTLDMQLLDKPCIVVSSDIKLRVQSKKVSFRYPDVMVVCGEPNFVDERVDTIDNPTVIVEVSSPSTALEDRNEKLEEYTRLESLQEYVLISQDEAKIERYLRHEGEWLYSNVRGLDAHLELPSIGVTLDFAFVYKKVTLKHETDNETEEES